MNIKMLGNRVLVEVEAKEEKTKGGFVLINQDEQGEVKNGTVVAVGPGKCFETGNLQSMEVKVGDKVKFRYGTVLLYEGKSYEWLIEDDVIAIFTDGRINNDF